MDDLSFFVAVTGWGLVPGLALLYALDVEWCPVERAAGAAGVSLALVAAAAYIAEAIGWPITPAPVLGVVAGLCVLAAVGRRWLERGRPMVPPMPAVVTDARPGWAPWLVWLLPLVIVSLLEPVSKVALLPPTLHDGLDHANWFRLIYEIHSLDPHVIAAPPLGPDNSPAYYPWGLHGWIALVAQTTTLDPVAVLMRCCVLISAAMPLSVYVFAASFVGRGWPAMAAAAASLFFWWLPFQVWGWGGYPLLAGAVAALPLSRLSLSVVSARSAIGIGAAGICAFGLLTIHPSQAFVALLITVVASLTFAASRLLPWWTTVPFLLALAAMGLVLGSGGGFWQPIDAFLERARSVGTALAGDARYRWPLGLYFDNEIRFPAVRQVVFGILCAAGAVYALINRSARPVLVLHLVFSLLIPLTAYQTWITSLWYHAPERIWYAQYASLPILAALGIAGLVALFERTLHRFPPPGLQRFDVPARLGRFGPPSWLRHLGDVNGASLAWLLALLGLFALVRPAYAEWASVRMFLFAQRNQQLTITDRRVLADFEWMRRNIPRGEVIFNAPADWGLPLPFTGHRTVFWTGGAAFDQALDWGALVSMLGRGGPHATHVADDLSAMGIRYVYAGVLDPRLARNGRIRLDGQVLEGAPRFEMLHRSPTARVFRITGDASGELLGLNDSQRIRFEGFHVRERLGRVTWRWSDGNARLRINTGKPAAKDCFVRIFGPAVGTYELRLGGGPLEFTDRGHRIPAAALTSEFVELQLVSEASAPTVAGTGTDERMLGLRVRNVSLDCGGREP
jgi:hypothetical protein